jgi:calcineurin-like phosphoesterase family protein
MNKIVLLFSFLFAQLSANSQGLENHLPAYAQYIITLNAQSYNGKADLNEISKMDFFKALNKEGKTPEKLSTLIAQIMVKPGDCGVELLPRAYLFRLDHDSVAGWVYLFSLKDQNAFSKFLKQSFREAGKPELTISQTKGYNRTESGLLSAAWTNDFAMLLVRDAYNPYAYSVSEYDSPSASTYADNQAKADSIAQAIADTLAVAEQEAQARELEASIAAEKKAEANSKKHVKKKTLSAADIQKEEQRAAMADSLAAVNAVEKAEKENAEWELKNKEREQKADQKTAERSARKLNELMNLPPAKSLLKVRTFTESQKESCDIALFMNYSGDAFPAFGPLSKKMYGNLSHVTDTSNSLAALTKDNYSVAYCTFEKGKINIRHKVFVNPEMDNLIDGLYNKKGNKNFVRYVKGTNLMGYASMSVDIKKTFKATRQILTKTYESTMDENAKFFTGSMDILSLFVNEDVADNLLKGDFMLAVTDLRPYQTTYTTSKFDDNFNRTESKEEKTEVLPEFVAMASVGKPEEMKKILKSVEKMGGIKEEGAGVYLIHFPGHTNYRVYVAMENNILFFTNNDELVHGKLKTGYAKKEQMTADQKSLLCNSAVAYYWNGTKTFEMIDKEPTFNKEAKMVKALHIFKDNLKDARMSGVEKQNNAYVTNMSMDLTDSSIYSLMSTFKMLNNFYLIEK